MTTLQKFDKTLGDFDQEVQKSSATAQIFAKIEHLAARQLEIQDQFAEQNEKLAQYNATQEEQKNKLDEDFKGLLQALEAQKQVLEHQKQAFEAEVATLVTKHGEQTEHFEKMMAAIYAKLQKQFDDIKATQTTNQDAIMTYVSEKLQKLEKDSADSFNEVIKSNQLRLDDVRKEIKGFTERELNSTRENIQSEVVKVATQLQETVLQQSKSVRLLGIFNIVLIIAMIVILFVK